MADIHLLEVKAFPDFKLYVRHADGAEGLIDMKLYLLSSKNSLCRELLRPTLFSTAELDKDDGVTWANGYDVCYDWTYNRLTGKDPYEVEHDH